MITKVRLHPIEVLRLGVSIEYFLLNVQKIIEYGPTVYDEKLV